MTDRAPLDLERITAAAGPGWSRITVVEETTSTNADLLADASAPDRSALAAEAQTAGRGRFDRVWTSPLHAGLTFSAIVRPDVPVAQWGWLPLLAGVALAEAVRDVAGVEDAALKWPNDLMVGDRKAAGILAQSSGDAAVIGIGLNVSLTPAELPIDTATSLQLAGATGTLDRSTLLGAILARLDRRVAQWSDRGGDAAACGLADAYRELCTTIGRDVRVSLGDGSVLEGRAVDVDESGCIVVDVFGERRAVGAGDVEHLRNRDR